MKNYQDSKIPVIVITGPTASGKSALAVALAERYNAEIISADSMQIYKGMDIASAKPDKEEMCGIKHHLIDFLSPDEKYSVAKFCGDTKTCTDNIRAGNKNVIICGGTGLYIDSFLGNISFEEQPDNTLVRRQLKEQLEKEGIGKLYERLMECDPETAMSLHINNEGRIIRALETYILTGEKPSVIRERSRKNPSPYKAVYIVLSYENREVLYERINRRVDIMLEKGLVDEAAQYFKLDKGATAAQAIGHKELIPFLAGEISLENAVENLKRATRNYAKRQMTWFRRNENAFRLYCDRYESFSDIVDAASEIIDSQGFIERGDEY